MRLLRKLQIRGVENEILRLLQVVDATPDLAKRLDVWWRIEERRTRLEALCGDDLTSELLRPRARKPEAGE
jgi:hypothetical protein